MISSRSGSLRELGELSLLDWIRQRAVKKTRGKGLLLGIGDDAAAFRVPAGEILLATSDAMAEGVHFDLSYTTYYQAGFKLVSVNASDIYAMGGAPRYALLDLSAPPELKFKDISSFFDGVLDALASYGALLAGGDVTASKSGLVLGMSMIGSAKKIVTRGGAKPGDTVYVTGFLGDSACGLELLKKLGRPVGIEKGKSASFGLKNRGGKQVRLDWNTAGPLVKRHLMPMAKKPPKTATAMIDISDGLAIDLIRLCKESRVGVKIYEDLLPVSEGLKKSAPVLGLAPLKLALGGGEDYELLYTAGYRASEKPSAFRSRGQNHNKKYKAWRIGEITRSGYIIQGRGGEERELKVEGYEHFTARKT